MVLLIYRFSVSSPCAHINGGEEAGRKDFSEGMSSLGRLLEIEEYYEIIIYSPDPKGVRLEENLKKAVCL